MVRREGDGQLFFAPSTWKDASGKELDDRSFVNALGPEARARSRPGGPPPGVGPSADLVTDDEAGQSPHIDTGDSDESED